MVNMMKCSPEALHINRIDGRKRRWAATESTMPTDHVDTHATWRIMQIVNYPEVSLPARVTLVLKIAEKYPEGETLEPNLRTFFQRVRSFIISIRATADRGITVQFIEPTLRLNRQSS